MAAKISTGIGAILFFLGGSALGSDCMIIPLLIATAGAMILIRSYLDTDTDKEEKTKCSEETKTTTESRS